MSLSTHRILHCNRCDKTETFKYMDGDTIPEFVPPRGWVAIEFASHGHVHFCPGCVPLVSMAVTEQKAVLVHFPFLPEPAPPSPHPSAHPPLTP